MSGAMKAYFFFPRGMQILPGASGTFANPQTTVGTFVGGDLDVEGYSSVVLVLDITAVSGTTPTLDVQIQEKDMASGKYVAVTTFSQKIATGTD